MAQAQQLPRWNYVDKKDDWCSAMSWFLLGVSDLVKRRQATCFGPHSFRC